jgi:choice-of-anchor C domain-containing protein
MRTLTVIAAAALFFLAVQRGAGVSIRPTRDKPTNLLVNGSFEEGPDPKQFLPLNKGSKVIKGWTVTRGQIDYVGSYWKAAHGKRSIDLHGSPGYGGIEQTIATRKGQHYRVTFFLAGTPGAGKKRVAVRAAAKKGEFSCDGRKWTKEKMGWAKHTWDFTAAGDTTTLEIHTLETTDPEQGPVLDNVSVLAVKK